MKPAKHDNHNDRQSASVAARKAMLERFQARPAPDDPAVLERVAAQRAVEEAREVRNAERRAAREADEARQAAERVAQALAEEQRLHDEAMQKIEDAKQAAALAAQQKAARDARYAARQNRRR